MNLPTLPNIKEASTYSEKIISKFRRALLKKFGDQKDVCVVVVGSFARREASEYSDLDFFVLSSATAFDKAKCEGVCSEVVKVAKALKIKEPSAGGAFAACDSDDVVTGCIGGMDDANDRLTRRMLFLFESDWLLNGEKYEEIFEAIIARYISDSITQHQLGKFLLNDLIRYYRTICVDFEHKTKNGKKSWGDRNIKLMFSRKLLYFSGILAIAETAERTPAEKRRILLRFLRMTPVNRISEICGEVSCVVLRRYDIFLGRLSKKSYRVMLEKTLQDKETHVEDFREFKNDGHHFSWELSSLLTKTFDVSHPIHHALRF